MLETVVTPSIHAISRHGARFMVVVIALLLIFKTELINLINSIFDKITSESSGI
ncbi:hypothetical protein L0P72_09835 [[Ruminococcus] torques]|nr:hypothetical protein [[Ruminococcus] torques]